MYLRETKRRNADGTTISYYQLAENSWDRTRGCAVAKVIYNFGRADALDRDSLRRLAASILRVCGGGDGDPTLLDSKGTEVADGVVLRDSWSFGGVHVLDAIWRELGVDRILTQEATRAGTKQPFERAIFAMVANRALSPYSKLYCWEQWLREEVFLPSACALELQHLYRAMDFLEEHKEEVEKAVYFSMSDLLNADVDLIFYDTTSLHFETDREDPDGLGGDDEEPVRGLRKRGYSKNGRSDVPQIVVGLAVTREGLPVRSWVFPGNQSDATTIEQVKRDLRGWRLGRCVFVADAGMNSERNRRQLSLGGGKYILASRIRAGDEVSKHVITRAGRYHDVADNLRVKEVIVGDGEARRRYVVCHNPLEAERQRLHRARVIEELEAELAAMVGRSDRTQRARQLLTTQPFRRWLRGVGDELKIDRDAVRRDERFDGKWVLQTNDDTLSPEDLALGYKQLLRVEACWRQLKSGLRMRPVYHYTERRIRAHVSLSVLALLLERVIETRANDTWRNVVAKLESIKVVEYDNGAARIQQTTELRHDVAALLARVRVELPPKLHAVRPADSAEA